MSANGLARRTTWVATARVPRKDSVANVSWRGQPGLVATVHPMSTPVARRRDWTDVPVLAWIALRCAPVLLVLLAILVAILSN